MLSLANIARNANQFWDTKSSHLVPWISIFHHRCPNFTVLAEKTSQNLLFRFILHMVAVKNTLLVQFSSILGPQDQKFGPWGTKNLHLFIGCGPSERHCQTEGPWWGTSPPVGLFKFVPKSQKTVNSALIWGIFEFFQSAKKPPKNALSCLGQLFFTSGNRGGWVSQIKDHL